MQAGDGSQRAEPDENVDVTLVRWMRSLSPAERLAVLQGFVDSVEELRGAAVAGVRLCLGRDQPR